MRELTHIVAPEEDGRRLESLLRGAMGLSRHRVSSLKFSGGIRLDGEKARTDARVRAGQAVSVLLVDPPAALAPGRLCVPVLFEDDDLLVVGKPAPLPSIRSARQGGETLENAVYTHLGCPPRFVYRPVSRLDKGTSGLMPIALNAAMHDQMQRLLHTDDYIREYLAVVEGAPPLLEGVCGAPIGRAEGVRRAVTPEGKPCRTRYKVLSQTNGRSLLLLRLETGRTHQIRVHMAHLGCPVCGDALYGSALPELPGRFALHSARLRFRHPLTGEAIDLQSPLPDALAALLRANGQADP
ncbi:MAG: RluA family pseudouridine synthase [Clostridia bacterium]|nr:RluA family pseudouridine synthase [Clostridia bacterium]